ncbi:DUF1971 domain-containing protein [Shewanella sp. 125m-7]
MTKIPADYVNYKSTPIFARDTVPKMFLHLHNTKAGVYGQIHVLGGELKFYGFTDRRGEVERELLLKEGDIGISPPQYWHKVEFLSDETRFRVDFWAQKDSDIVAQNLSERD